MSVYLKTLFEEGSEHNVASLICSFAGRKELLHVSKAVRRTTQNALVDLGRTLAMNQPAQVQKIQEIRQSEIADERPPAEILPALFDEVNAQMRDLHPHLAHDIERANKLQEYRDRLAEIRNRWRAAENGDAKERHINHLLIALQQSKPLLADVRERLDAHQPYADDRDSPFVKLAMLFNACIIEENVANRFRKVTEGRNPQNPQEILSCLSLLRQDQRAAMTREIREDFSRYEEAHAGSFSAGYFTMAETHVLRAEHENDEALCLLWRRVQPQINAGPLPGSSPRTIREWITDDANRGPLGQVHHLSIMGASHLPREIERLHNLESLSCQGTDQGRLSELPAQMANLRNLDELSLYDNSFPEIPRVLERIPVLQEVTLTGNTHPIRVFPTWLDAHLHRGFSGGVILTLENEASQLIRLDNFLGLRILPFPRAGDPRLFHGQYAGLPREELTDIPFACWFRENFAIPNGTVYFSLGLVEFVLRMLEISELYQQGWFEMTRALLLPLIPAAAWFGLLIGGVLLAPAPLLLAIFLSLEISNLSFIPNAIMHYLICPIVEEIREELGYDPIVHIHDIPEASAQA